MNINDPRRLSCLSSGLVSVPDEYRYSHSASCVRGSSYGLRDQCKQSMDHGSLDVCKHFPVALANAADIDSASVTNPIKDQFDRKMNNDSTNTHLFISENNSICYLHQFE